MRPAGYLDVGSVPSGDALEHMGDLVIHGSIAKGASIVASGDVICLGCLQGSVHAGADLGSGANGSARVVALEMRGARIKIAGTKTLGDAKVTLSGPHTAYLATSGRSCVIQVQPLGRTRPTPGIAAIGASFWRWKRAYPAAATSLFTGIYALLAGAALIAAPRAVLGLLFDAGAVPAGWIRVGGVLFGTFGLQYIGTAWGDWCRVAQARKRQSDRLADKQVAIERQRLGMVQQAAERQRQRDEHDADGTGAASAEHASLDSAARAQRAAAEGETESPLFGWDDGFRDGFGSVGAATAEDDRRHSNLLYSSSSFYQASVWSRLVLAAAFVLLVSLRCCEPGLLLLAAANAAGAVSMAMALRRQWLLHTIGATAD